MNKRRLYWYAGTDGLGCYKVRYVLFQARRKPTVQWSSFEHINGPFSSALAAVREITQAYRHSELCPVFQLAEAE